MLCVTGNELIIFLFIHEKRTESRFCAISNTTSRAWDMPTSKIQAAYEETDMAKRNELLHEAEEILLDKMPVIPILFNRSASLASSKLKRVYYDYYGYAVFTRTELRNYHKYLITEED